MRVHSSWFDKTLFLSCALLAAVLVIFQVTDFDIRIQDLLYNFQEQRWLVDRYNPATTFWFHRFPKYVIGAVVVGQLLKAGASIGRSPAWLRPVAPVRVLVLLLCLGLTTGLVALGKETTGSFCPWEVERYGGDQPYIKTWSKPDPAHPPTRCGKCWPAGHASGGYALFALATVAVTRRGQMYGLLTGFLTGSVMGIYQMLKGAHYTSDTLVTMLLAWIIHLALRRILLSPADRS